MQAEAGSASYDSLLSRERQRFRLDKRIARLCGLIRDNFGARENLAFLEIGFAHGEHMLAWKERFPGAHMDGVEVDAGCVEKMRAAGFNCRLVDKELFDCDAKYDVIYGGAVLHHISKPFDYLLHLYGMLNAGGMIFFENETQRYSLIDMLYITFYSWNWKYETNLFKLSRRVIEKFCRRNFPKYEFAYDAPSFVYASPLLSQMEDKLQLKKIPIIRCIGPFNLLIQKPWGE